MNWRDFVVVATMLVLPNFLLAEVEYQIGPYDYINPNHQKHFPIVEKYHFRQEERILQRGNDTIWNDLEYTLRVIPNHHGALASMGRLLRMKNPGVMIYGKPVEKDAGSYFQRAMEFSPNDGVVRMLYGIHFHKLLKLKQALKMYQEAEKWIPGSSEIHYNIGLLYMDLNEHEKALKYAKRAYELGYPLPGLRKKLQRVGKWQK